MCLSIYLSSNQLDIFPHTKKILSYCFFLIFKKYPAVSVLLQSGNCTRYCVVILTLIYAFICVIITLQERQLFSANACLNGFPSLLDTEVYSSGIPENLGTFHSSPKRKGISHAKGSALKMKNPLEPGVPSCPNINYERITVPKPQQWLNCTGLCMFPQMEFNIFIWSTFLTRIFPWLVYKYIIDFEWQSKDFFNVYSTSER